MADNNNGGGNNDYFEDRAGTKEARYHVVPHQEDGWAVKREGEDNPESTYSSRDEAVDAGKKMAKEAGTMVYIHNEHGKIETQENYEEWADKNND